MTSLATSVLLVIAVPSAANAFRELPDMMSALEGRGGSWKIVARKVASILCRNQFQMQTRGEGGKIRKFCGHNIWKLSQDNGILSFSRTSTSEHNSKTRTRGSTGCAAVNYFNLVDPEIADTLTSQKLESSRFTTFMDFLVCQI